MFVGRTTELERLVSLVTDARDHRGGALLVDGPAGIGKSTLVAQLAAEAHVPTVEVHADRSEQDLSWAALHQLVHSLRGHIGDLPAGQQEALVAVLTGTRGADRLAVATAALSLVAAAARDRPMLVIVEDVQWLDAPSADTLAFLVRRLGHDPVAVVLTQRSDEPRALAATGVPVLALQPLAPDEARSLLRATRPELRDQVAERLIEAAGGHPLALVETGRALTAEQALGRVPLPDPVPAGPGVERLFRDRLDRLPETCRQALLVVSVAGGADIGVLTSSWAALGLTQSALAPAETAGLVTVDGRRVMLRHPLVASAVRSLADAPARRATHAALAAALPPDGDAALWHRAEAATAPDVETGRALGLLGRRERSRAPGAAERAFVRAAELLEDPAERADALLDAATAGAEAGPADRAAAYLAQCLELTDDPLRRAAARHLQARLDIKRGRSADAAQLLVDEAASIAPTDPARAAAMLADAIEPWLHAGHPERAYQAGAGARALVPATAVRQRVEVELRIADALGWQGRDAEACALWRGLAATVDASPELRNDAWSRYNAGEALFSAGDDGDAIGHLRAALELARTSGATGALPHMSVVLVWTLCRLGELAAARKVAGDAVAAAIALGNLGDEAWCLAAHSWVDAMTGDELGCRRHAADAEELAHRLGLVGLETADMSLGLLELSLGRHPTAVTHLERALAEHERRGPGDAAAPRSVTGLLVEALVRAGREDDARARLDAFEAALVPPARPTSQAAAARCRGLLADDFEAAFDNAIALYEAAGHRFEAARTQLCLGERLRRVRRRSDARMQLRTAEAAFAAMGAVQWQARAAEELAATGERRRVDAPTGLTPHEQRVAELVSTGLTNREVAAALFLSEKTIEAHLGRVFRKLDVRSRTGLAAALSRSYPRDFPDSTDGVRA